MGSLTLKSKYMEYTLQNMIVETGVLGKIFPQDYRIYGCLATYSWIK